MLENQNGLTHEPALAPWAPGQELEVDYTDRRLGWRAHFLFEYDPETGCLVSRFTQVLAGYINTPTAHKLVRIDGHTFSAARVVWVMHHFGRNLNGVGRGNLKHINKFAGDDRIENLLSGNGEIVQGHDGWSVKVVMPGRMPARLGPFATASQAQAAGATYTAKHAADDPPEAVVPEEVARALTAIGYPVKVRARWESRMAPEIRAHVLPRLKLGPLPARAVMRSDIDDLI